MSKGVAVSEWIGRSVRTHRFCAVGKSDWAIIQENRTSNLFESLPSGGKSVVFVEQWHYCHFHVGSQRQNPTHHLSSIAEELLQALEFHSVVADAEHYTHFQANGQRTLRESVKRIQAKQTRSRAKKNQSEKENGKESENWALWTWQRSPRHKRAV